MSEAHGPPARASGEARRSLSRRSLLLGAATLTAGAAVGGVVLSHESAPVPLVQRATFGAYADNSPYPDLSAFQTLQDTVGARLPVMSWFQDMAAPWLGTDADQAATGGHDLCIAWQPADAGRPIPFAELLAGRWDDQLDDFFRAAATYPGRVTLRPFWEMNTAAPTYSVLNGSSTGQVRDVVQFRATWRHLVGRQRSIGGDRVGWMFCVNGSDVGGPGGVVPMEEYWPGVDWVDEVGLDTYNDHWAPWGSFAEKVRPMYDRLTGLAPGLPVVVAETGSRENDDPTGQTKADWMRELFACTEFPALTGVYFFSADLRDDFRLDSSPAVAEACRQALPGARGGRQDAMR